MSARRSTLISAFVFAGVIVSPSARAQEPSGEEPSDEAPAASGDGVGSSDFARVSALQGELFVKGPFDEQEQTVTMNAFLREGDELRTGADTFLELELPHSTFIRIAPQTAARLETIEDQVELDVVHGSVYLSQGPDAPDAAIVAERGSVGTDSRGVVRFEVETGAGGYTVARVAEGSAEASCQGKFSTLGARETLSCKEGGATRGEWSPERGDAFDRWSQDREKKVRNYQAPPAAVAGNYEGLQDLDGNGEWVVVEQRHYWRPYVEVSWRPYYDGYWSWCDWLGGWTWVSYSPWGHVTHHYGRWIWLGHHGWVWSPAAVFSPAWVVWASFDGYLGWAPCDHWGRPVVVASAHTYYDHYAWSFSRPTYFVGGGGNPRRVIRNAQVYPRPFFTLGNDDLRHLRARPVRDPRELMPQHASIHPRSEGPRRANFTNARSRPERVVDRPHREVRPWPKSSLLPRLVEEDSRRSVQVHEAVRDPLPPPRREMRTRRDDDGIPINTRPQQRRITARDTERNNLDRDGDDDRRDPVIDRRPAVRQNEDGDDRGQIRRTQPERAYQPTYKPSQVRPVDQRPVEQRPVEQRPTEQRQAEQRPAQRPTQVRPTEPSRSVAPARRDPPQRAQPSQSQPAPRPNVQPQPSAPSKPSYTPSKPSPAVNKHSPPPRADKGGGKNKKGR